MTRRSLIAVTGAAIALVVASVGPLAASPLPPATSSLGSARALSPTHGRLAGSLASGSTAATRSGAAASPSIDPSKFTATIDNPWFPLKPGTTLTYNGTKDGKPAVDIYTVTSKTRVIDGVTTRIIRDRLFLSGTLSERTVDYYAQDAQGNVWYFGEDTQELDAKGTVIGTAGSWRAGVDGAVPGIFMEATPRVGHSFAQEYYKGHAEDHFAVVALSVPVKVPYGSFTGALRTKEWTPLAPKVLDSKYYVRGIGMVREVTVKGPREELVLTKITH